MPAFDAIDEVPDLRNLLAQPYEERVDG